MRQGFTRFMIYTKGKYETRMVLYFDRDRLMGLCFQGKTSKKTRLAHRFFDSTRTLPTEQVQEEKGRERKEVSLHRLKGESRKREPNYPTI